MKAFISYSTKDKVWGGRVKTFFDNCNIPSFLAHDDLKISEEWKKRIYKELNSSDIFVCLLSRDFIASDWCSQEIGIAYAKKDVGFIPISLDGSPSFGFISHIQSTVIQKEFEIEEFIAGGLLRSNLSKGIDLSIELTRGAGSFRSAEMVVKRLVPYFDKMEHAHAKAFAEASTENRQVWDAGYCRNEYLPKFLEVNNRKASNQIFQSLQYKIEN